MNPDSIRGTLEKVSQGELSVDQALAELKKFPFEEIGYATVDHHRSLRQGYPEVIFGQGKTADEIIGIMTSLVEAGENVLATKLPPEIVPAVKEKFPEATYHTRAQALTLIQKPRQVKGRGKIMIISAGTSDAPVAEEAFVTASVLGHEVDLLRDVGVAGLHRLLGQADRLEGASVYVVVAGMEGALPSVVGGLVDKPVIAVPTSVGYGASFGGLTALLAMLNSCASGVAVVNIDNGFGAAFLAAQINRL
ncbi:MAG: nickel pincer cofactor biosynthesis protein LarB [Deltaproteobacteria bacterium]|nr:nickel pincer cofactor biosynthesis protein LarB [Deltaproteobacteria bacterium]MBW2084602.1 nickel pincer cofactor biosynthesis protein LarB [Deltaproteobacteria bacterium]